jgi:charged multivesicular body protein 2A
MKSMNRGLNLPQIQRIMNEFERESATMDMKEEMMSDAVDDAMDDELEDEEEESDKILKQVLDEIGVGLSQQVCVFTHVFFYLHSPAVLPISSLPMHQQA